MAPKAAAVKKGAAAAPKQSKKKVADPLVSAVAGFQRRRGPACDVFARGVAGEERQEERRWALACSVS
jgi:hypothetical protein